MWITLFDHKIKINYLELHGKTRRSLNEVDACGEKQIKLHIRIGESIQWNLFCLPHRYLAQHIPRLWRWRWYVPPKRRLTFNGLHGFISQMIVFLIQWQLRRRNECLKTSVQWRIHQRNALLNTRLSKGGWDSQHKETEGSEVSLKPEQAS
jgi:hypothetical protein